MSKLLHMTFSSFLESQYLAWQQKAGKRKPLEEFAAYLGISQPLLSLWMNGKRKPGPENIELLANVFGAEVYDSLGLPRPDPDLLLLSKIWPHLPEDMRRTIRQQAEEYDAQNEQDEQPAPKAKRVGDHL